MNFLLLQLLLVHAVHIYTAFDNWNGDGFLTTFSVVNQGRMNGFTVLMFRQKIDLEECVYYCLQFVECVTVTYNDRLKECELNDIEFDEYEADLDAKDWTNYGQPPKVNGQYSEWQVQSKCSSTCGLGTLFLKRFCNNPSPQNNGKDCPGADVKTEACNNGPCPGPGTWGVWGSFSTCSTTCGSGEISRTRTCITPAAGTRDCETTAGTRDTTEKEIQDCNNVPCPGTCVYENNTVYDTGLVGFPFVTPTWMECSIKCFEDANCHTWTWNTLEFSLVQYQRQCRIRSGGNLENKKKFAKQGKMSGMKSCGKSDYCTFEYERLPSGLMRLDDDPSLPVPSDYKSCSENCFKKDICQSWSFHNKKCQMYSTEFSLISNKNDVKGSVMGSKSCGLNHPCKVEMGISYDGNVLSETKGSMKDCSQTCLEDERCTLWEWIESSKRCFLKSSNRKGAVNLDGKKITGTKECAPYII